MRAVYKHLLLEASYTGLSDATHHWAAGMSKFVIKITNTLDCTNCVFDYHTHSAITRLSCQDLLDALQSFLRDGTYTDGSYQDFCDNLDYDSNLISSRHTYDICFKMKQDANHVIGNDQWIYDAIEDLSYNEQEPQQLPITSPLEDDEYYLTL
jgi:hypothetical protein